MIEFQLIYVSGDRRKVSLRETIATDIDEAAALGVDSSMIESWAGKDASWFLAGVVQLDCSSETVSALEAVQA